MKYSVLELKGKTMRVYKNNNRSWSDFTTMYQKILGDLIEFPEYKIAPRGLPIGEFINVTVITDPNDCHIDFLRTEAPERQEVYDKYCKAELEWYLSGNTLASSAPSKFWNQLAGPDGHITSNYGHMMLHDKIFPIVGSDEKLTNIERVVEVLTKDPDSRQAVVFYGQPRHYWAGNMDQPCTLSGQFFIRDSKLHYTVTQRSCDIWLGFQFDCPWQCFFQKIVLEKLNEKGMNITLGNYTHVFGSLHLYEKNLEMAKKVISSKLPGEN